MANYLSVETEDFIFIIHPTRICPFSREEIRQTKTDTEKTTIVIHENKSTDIDWDKNHAAVRQLMIATAFRAIISWMTIVEVFEEEHTSKGKITHEN